MTHLRPLLVVGIGNVLLRDEGVGVHVVERLDRLARRRPDVLPPECTLVDGGTLGLDLLPMIEDARAVVLVDAVNLRGAPGDVRVLHGPDLHATLANHVSPHQVGVGDLLAAARLRGTLPADVALVGIQPAEIEIGLELTAAVEAAVARAADVACETAWELHRAAGGADGAGRPLASRAPVRGDAAALGAPG